MSMIRTIRRRLWIYPGLLTPMVLAGCLCRGAGLIDKCATIPPGAIPQPLGTHTNTILGRQVNKAEADQYVIYLYEWIGDTAKFGPFGSKHIEKVAVRLPNVTFPVIIEPDCDPAINETRRVTVIAYLEQKGVSTASERVRIGYPAAEGLYGEEAERIFRQMLRPQSFNTNNYNNQGLNQGNGLNNLQGGVGGLAR